MKRDDLVTALGLAVQDRPPEPLRLICWTNWISLRFLTFDEIPQRKIM
jgi:hypothetical protein